MIQNEKGLRYQKKSLKNLRKALETSDSWEDSIEQPWLKAAKITTLKDMIQEAETAIKEYEDLQNGLVTLPDLSVVASLGKELIRRRIAKRWTQAQLAKKMKLATQQIQRYEHTRYETATLLVLRKVAAQLSSVEKPAAAPARTSESSKPTQALTQCELNAGSVGV